MIERYEDFVMAFRSLIQHASCQLSIKNEFTTNELIFTVSPFIKIDNAAVPQNEISYVPPFNEPYDETFIGPFKVRIQPGSDSQQVNNTFTISISLDEQREPYGNLLETIGNNKNYEKLRNSKLLPDNIRYYLLPEYNEFFATLVTINKILLTVNQHNFLYPLDERNRAENDWENFDPSAQIEPLVNTYFQNLHDDQMRLNKSMIRFNQDTSVPEDIKKQIKQLVDRQTDPILKPETIVQLKNKLIDIVQLNISPEMLKKLETVFEQLNQINDASKWLVLKHIEKIMGTLKEAKLLNDANINHLCVFIQEQNRSIPEYLQHLQFVNSLIPKINQCGLLTQEIFNDVFSGIKLDYSSQARLKGFGLEAVNTTAKQQRWGYYSKAVEENLLQMMENKKSLAEMLNYAAFMRQKIAMIEGIQQFEEYGSLRTGLGVTGDIYRKESSKDLPSILDPALFPNLVDTVGKLALSDANKTKSASSVMTPFGLFNDASHYEFELSRTSKHNIKIPKEFITIITRQNKEIFSISTKFSGLEKKQWDEAIDKLNVIYQKKLQQKPVESSVDPLLEICELAGHLVDFYPYKRGSGGIIKWVIRSMLQFHYGKDLNQELNDLRINKIPFDVYAQMVTFEEFVSALYASIKPLLSPAVEQSIANKR